MGFFDRFRRKKTEIAPELARNDRNELQERRLQLQERVLREHRAGQLGDEAVFPVFHPDDPYLSPTKEQIRAYLGLPPKQIFIKAGQDGVEIVQKPVKTPYFTPENRPETLIASEKLFDRGIDLAKRLDDEEV